MFKKAFERTLPCAIGMFTNLVVVSIVTGGIEVAIKCILPDLVGLCAGFYANLYFIKRQDKGDKN